MESDSAAIPPHLQPLWDDLAQRHPLDPAKPATSLFQAYTTLAQEVAQQLADVERQLADVQARQVELLRRLGLRGQTQPSADGDTPPTCVACASPFEVRECAVVHYGGGEEDPYA